MEIISEIFKTIGIQAGVFAGVLWSWEKAGFVLYKKNF